MRGLVGIAAFLTFCPRPLCVADDIEPHPIVFRGDSNTSLITPVQDDASLYDIQFIGSQLGWAVGDHGVIWKTTDGGQTWPEAQLGEQVSRFAWGSWSFRWDARPGKYMLGVRATDAQDRVQPIEQPWNFKGMGNNMVQWVEVLVE